MVCPVDASLKTCTLEPVWFIWTELANRDDDEGRIRRAVCDAVGLSYGPNYDSVCFESAEGTQFFRPRKGSLAGEEKEAYAFPARSLTFSIPRDAEMLAAAIEALREHHSYEEPVIYVLDGYATRADYSGDGKNPYRWNNR